MKAELIMSLFIVYVNIMYLWINRAAVLMMNDSVSILANLMLVKQGRFMEAR